MSDVPNVGIGAALGDAGAAPVVVLDGKTWTIGYPTQRAKSELEMLVVQVAQQNLEDLKAVLKPVQFATLRGELDEKLLARVWQTWGELWSAVTNGPLGFPLFLLSLAKPFHPEMTVAIAETLWQRANPACRLALKVVVPDFFNMLTSFLPADDASKAAQAANLKALMNELLEQSTLTA